MPTPTDIAQRQLDAYNAHDLDAFCACFADDVVVALLVGNEILFEGKAKLRETYADRFGHPNLHAKLVNRIACGRVVIDEEEVTGLNTPTPLHVIAIYEIEADLIRKVRFERAG